MRFTLFKSFLATSVATGIVLACLDGQRTPPAARVGVERSPGMLSPPEPALAEPLHPVAGFSWTNIEAAHYPTFIANLRRIGCPEETLCDILVADLLNGVTRAGSDGARIWNVLLSNFPDQAKARETALFANALMGRPTITITEPVANERLKSPLGPAHDSSALARIETEMAARAAAVWGRLGTNPPSEADLAALSGLQSERKAALQELLSEQELEHYEVRASGALASMLDAYSELNLSENEALQLIELQKARENHQPPFVNSTAPGQADERNAESEIRAVLGETRYADYERLQNPDYVRFQAFAGGAHLPPERVTPVFDRLLSTGELQSPHAVAAELDRQFGGNVGQQWLQLIARGQAFTARRSSVGNGWAP